MKKIVCFILFLLSYALNSYGGTLIFVSKSNFPIEFFVYYKVEQNYDVQVGLLEFKEDKIELNYSENEVGKIAFTFAASPERVGFNKFDLYSYSSKYYLLSDILNELSPNKKYYMNDSFQLNNKYYFLDVFIQKV